MTYIATSGKVGVYRIPDKAGEGGFAGYYGLSHIGTGLHFPTIYEFSHDAMQAAPKVDDLCAWDAYVDRVKKRDVTDAEDLDLKRQIWAISDEHGGECLPSTHCLDHQKIALIRRAAMENES